MAARSDAVAGTAAGPLELWGGVECTVNRVGDSVFTQLDRAGHTGRLADLSRFADLGLKAIRYPVLWETTAPDGIERADWRFADERLDELRRLGIRPSSAWSTMAADPDTRAFSIPASRPAWPASPRRWPSVSRGSTTGRR
jgi:hypothetical protein